MQNYFFPMKKFQNFFDLQKSLELSYIFFYT